VDIDFPVVFRAFAGADSLAQAAGRCNREGKIAEGGIVDVFFPPSEPPRGLLSIAKQRTEVLWREGLLDLANPETFREYFRRLYSGVDRDPGVLAAERSFQFEESAKLFRMIQETGEAVVAPYSGADARVQELRRAGVTRMGLRRLQPFLVNLYPQEIQVLASAGAIERLEDRLWFVLPQFSKMYNARFGFGWTGGFLLPEPESLIA
jgi:CRISPR-associated endonuclease/helicase Cas3